MIIVTGGAGLIGSAIIYTLNKAGYTDILVVDNLNHPLKEKNLEALTFKDYLDKKAFIQQVDSGSWTQALDGIIHMGACSSTTEEDMDYLMSNNVNYSKSLAKLTFEKQCRFIYASSAATYGDGKLGFDDDPTNIPNLTPINKYGTSKQLFDQWILENKLENKVVGLKFFNVFGPNEYHKGSMQSVVCKAVDQIKDSGILKLFKSYHPDYPDGGQCRDFIYVKDCAKVATYLFNTPTINGIYNLGTGKANTWNDLGNAVFSAMDIKSKIEYIEMPQNLINQYQYFTEAKMQRLSAQLPFQMTPLKEAVKDYVTHYLLNEKAHLSPE
ncbi:ADP-glyceromanno-heptose 6-epimerase [Candidatus Marinamargulisbacteria bacterium SCGC AG-439-L15]|nr:ADP-glyceromanno-heptose 6-epimerase [Candidatus Marinamargulisbacteria bacterium SCGC AG-439-L15]